MSIWSIDNLHTATIVLDVSRHTATIVLDISRYFSGLQFARPWIVELGRNI